MRGEVPPEAQNMPKMRRKWAGVVVAASLFKACVALPEVFSGEYRSFFSFIFANCVYYMYGTGHCLAVNVIVS